MQVFVGPYYNVYGQNQALSLYGRVWVSGNPHPCMFYVVCVLVSLQFFKVGEYGHAELDVFSGFCWCEFAGEI